VRNGERLEVGIGSFIVQIHKTLPAFLFRQKSLIFDTFPPGEGMTRSVQSLLYSIGREITTAFLYFFHFPLSILEVLVYNDKIQEFRGE
jgi:hypothetical protein